MGKNEHAEKNKQTFLLDSGTSNGKDKVGTGVRVRGKSSIPLFFFLISRYLHMDSESLLQRENWAAHRVLQPACF